MKCLHNIINVNARKSIERSKGLTNSISNIRVQLKKSKCLLSIIKKFTCHNHKSCCHISPSWSSKKSESPVVRRTGEKHLNATVYKTKIL